MTGVIRLHCGCSPVDGQDCPACDGQLAELGITAQPAEPPPAAPAATFDDPWFNPTAALVAPF